ncbi:acyl-CoA/acyl-ACP dehydrogenase [Bradyrhizobium sp. 21]|nr:acyl-CoA/acyl-ACP dehydrogenase [Bradyrhizobium sp. 21]
MDADAATDTPRLDAIRRRALAAAEVAARFADDVDRNARFPSEAMEVLKQQRLLSVLVPASLDGYEASISEVATVCRILGRTCASTAMVYAMHQLVVASLVAHASQSKWHLALLRRVAEEQLLFASATTEGGVGGDIRRSICGLEYQDGRFILAKNAPVISYGEYADAILVTARRTSTSAPSDQVAVVVTRDSYSLEPLSNWDTLGMRGTCSRGFQLHASGAEEQILPGRYGELLAKSGMPLAHVLWGSVWFGIATDALERARSFVKSEAKKKPNETSPGAVLLARAIGDLGLINSELETALKRYALASERGSHASGGFAILMNGLKVNISQTATSVVGAALEICGLAGYRNDSVYSINRHLRDILSAPLMIHNDRILLSTASALLMHPIGDDLFGEWASWSESGAT